MNIGIVSINLGRDVSYRVKAFAVGGVFRAESVESYPGGKGVNVARALKLLGATPRLFGCVGGSTGRYIISGLRAENIPFNPVRIRGESRTCVHVVDTARPLQTVINEPGPSLSQEERNRLRARFRVWCTGCQAMVLTGSLPRGVPSNMYAMLCRDATAQRIPVVIDASGEALRCGFQARPMMVKPNRTEFEALTGRQVSDRDLPAALRALSVATDTIIAVTLGADGVIAGYRGKLIVVRPPVVRVVSAIGSGDAFVAGFISQYLRTSSLEESLRYGVACGALNAMTDRPGVLSMSRFQAVIRETRVRLLD